MRLLEKLENRPLKIRCKEDQEKIIRILAGSEMELLVDMRPFMQRDPFIVQSDASLSRAYRLFRTMGLRHLFVCPPQPKVFVGSKQDAFKIADSDSSGDFRHVLPVPVLT